MRAVGRLWTGLGTLLLATALIGVACSIGYTPPPTIQPTNIVQKPAVSIQNPQDNADAVVGQAITVQASGSHPDGVTRMELRANGVTVDSKISQNPSGDQQFAAYLNYTPTTAGTLQLQVIAYRGTVASDPAVITLNVKAQEAQVTATVDQPTGGDQGGAIDPTCRARVEVNGLNFRQGPGQTFPPLAVLSLGTFIPLTGRSADYSWWQGTMGNTVGWMNRNFITLLGSLCNSIPVVQAPSSPTPATTPTGAPPPQVTATSGLPDLAVVKIDGPVTVNLDANNHATVTYKVTVQNNGGPSGPFNVAMVLPDGTAQDMGAVPGLSPGQQAIFQTDVTFTAPGSVRLAAVADSKQVVTETDKTNNVKTLDVVLIKAAQ